MQKISYEIAAYSPTPGSSRGSIQSSSMYRAVIFFRFAERLLAKPNDLMISTTSVTFATLNISGVGHLRTNSGSTFSTCLRVVQLSMTQATRIRQRSGHKSSWRSDRGDLGGI